MKSLFKIGILVLFSHTFSGCIVQNVGPLYLGQKDDCGFAVSQLTGEGLRWEKSKFPIPFYIHRSVPDEAHRNFIAAVEHWNIAWEDYLYSEGLEPFPLFTVVNRNMKHSGSPRKDYYNMIFFVYDNFTNYENSSVQAFTSINSNRSAEINDTDIVVNNDNFKYFYDDKYNKEVLLSKKEIKKYRSLASSRSENFWQGLKQQIKSWFQFLIKPFQKAKPKRHIATPSPRVPRGYVDFASLMIHELGHVPGLAHFDGDHSSASKRGHSRDSFVSVMEPKLVHGRARRAIKDYDLNNLFCGYFGY